jgi:hypothetical protein
MDFWEGTGYDLIFGCGRGCGCGCGWEGWRKRLPLCPCGGFTAPVTFRVCLAFWNWGRANCPGCRRSVPRRAGRSTPAIASHCARRSCSASCSRGGQGQRARKIIAGGLAPGSCSQFQRGAACSSRPGTAPRRGGAWACWPRSQRRPPVHSSINTNCRLLNSPSPHVERRASRLL